jgi:vacuolar-type H+-ATPase subunit I/STV1
MSVAVISEIFGYVAVTCGFIMTMIQAVRIQRHGPEGVSVYAWSLFLWTNTFFAVYAWAVRYWPVAIGASVISPIMLFIVLKTGPKRAIKPLALSFAIVFAVAMVPVLIWNWDAGIPGAIAINIGLGIPAIIALYKSDTAEGAAASSWLINGAATFLLMISALLAERWVFAGAQALVCVSHLSIATATILRHQKLRRIATAAAGG